MMDRGPAIAAGLLAGLLVLAASAEAQITFVNASSGRIGTRFYLQNAAADLDPATERGAWNSTTGYTARKLSRTKAGAIASKGTAETSTTNNYDVLLLKLVSEPITTAQTISGTLNWVVGAGQSDAAMNAYWHVHVYVLRSSDTWVGTLLTNAVPMGSPSGAAEWGNNTTTAQGWGPQQTPLALTPVAIQANDRIVIELGYAAQNTIGTSYTGTVWYGGTSATNLALNGDETTLPGWFEFSQNLFPATDGLAMPSGTTNNDVMIASIGVRPSTATVATLSTWTFVNRVDNPNGNTNSLWIFRKVASGDTGPYNWAVTGASDATGGIQTFRGVDNANPIDTGTVAGQCTPAGNCSDNAQTNHLTPSVTTTVTNTMLVTAYTYASSWPWTLPGVTEGFDIASQTGTYGISTAGGWVSQAAIGASGAKTGTTSATDRDVGNAHILALRPGCASTADADYVSAAAPTGGTPSMTVYWSSANAPLILRKSATAFAADQVPVHGTSYTAGSRPWGSGSADLPYVIYNGTTAMSGVTCNTTSCTDTSGTLSNGTVYYYKVFPKLNSCYASGIGAEVNLTPVASGHSWSYTLAGGSILKAGIAGEGAIYTGSNANRIVSLSTSNGTQTWAPVATNEAVQGWLSWIFISGGSDTAVIGGDQSARVYSINPATGATNWTKDLSGSGADGIQAPAAAQLRVLSDATFQSTHTTDLIFAATRNASSTNNKVFALRVSDGSVAWTFNGNGTDYQVDYIVGQPYVDYGRNRVYVASRAGGGSQSSLWVLNTLNGALVASFPLGHMPTSPTLSYSGATLWVGNESGDLYAINTATLAQKWTSPAALGSAVKGFVWEDQTTAGRLYFSTADGNVWCLQDPGAGSPPNPASPVWKTLVAGASMPLLLDALYVGSSDGNVHELNVITGVDANQYLLGGTVGDLSTENSTEVFAPTSAGKIYKIPLPMP